MRMKRGFRTLFGNPPVAAPICTRWLVRPSLAPIASASSMARAAEGHLSRIHVQLIESVERRLEAWLHQEEIF
jgi:hypothetical protein